MAANLWELKALPGYSGIPKQYYLTFNDENLFGVFVLEELSNVDKTQTLQAIVNNLNLGQGGVILEPIKVSGSG